MKIVNLKKVVGVLSVVLLISGIAILTSAIATQAQNKPEASSKERRKAAEALLHKGHELAEAKRFDEARKIYQQVIEEYPDYDGSDMAWFSMANDYVTLGDYKKALELYKKWMIVHRKRDKYPEVPEEILTKWAYQHLARTVSQTGRHEDTVKIYHEILDRWPQDVGALHDLGTHYAYVEDYEKALELLKEAIRVKEKKQELSKHDMASVYLSIGTVSPNFEKSIEAFQKVIELVPDSQLAEEAKRWIAEEKRMWALHKKEEAERKIVEAKWEEFKKEIEEVIMLWQKAFATGDAQLLDQLVSEQKDLPLRTVPITEGHKVALEEMKDFIRQYPVKMTIQKIDFEKIELKNATVTISTTLYIEKLDPLFMRQSTVHRYTFFLVRENGKWKVFYTTMAMSFEASRIPPEAIIQGRKKGE